MFKFFKKDQEAVQEIPIYALCDGELIKIESVKDEVFAQKMMGDGYAIVPSNGTISAPIEGAVDNIFPTKHALGLKNGQGLEVLIHMGIDTVSLEGAPFEVSAREGQQVSPQTPLAEVDLAALDQAGKDNAMIVVITNSQDFVDRIEYTVEGPVQRGDLIGHVYLAN